MAIGRVNTGGGGSGGTLEVTAPVGVTVTATKSGKSYTRTANAQGKATFKGLASGVWSVTISDGTQTSAAVGVTVTADYAVTMAFFSATINVTYPAGSTCTCTKGGTTLTASGTGGSYTFTVPEAGEWTVSCTDGDKTASKSVTITAQGQIESVTLVYEFVLFDNGDTCDSVTGGWKWSNTTAWNNTITWTNEASGMGGKTLWVQNTNERNRINPVNTIDLTPYTTLYAHIVHATIARNDGVQILNGTTQVGKVGVTVGDDYIVSIDVTEFNAAYTIQLRTGSNGNSEGHSCDKIWLEE